MPKNTNALQNGEVRYVVFKEDNVWYGVALEFNIVVDGDSADLVLLDLLQAIRGYIESVKKSKLKGKIYLAPVDAEYEAMWRKSSSASKPVRSPFSIFTFGTQIVNL